MAKPNLGQALKDFRIEKGLSQEALAEISGVNSANITRIERGTTPTPGWDVVAKLCRGLGISTDDLVAATTEEAVSLEDIARHQLKYISDVALDFSFDHQKYCSKVEHRLIESLSGRSQESLIKILKELKEFYGQMVVDFEGTGPAFESFNDQRNELIAALSSVDVQSSKKRVSRDKTQLDWTALKDAVERAGEKTAKAVEHQRVTFVKAVEEQRAEYIEVMKELVQEIRGLNKRLDRIEDNIDPGRESAAG